MVKSLCAAAAAFAVAAAVYSQQPNDATLLERARALHKQSPLIDGHNDYPWALREKAQRNLDQLDIAKPQPLIMTDIPRV
jgi:membrane dipeptidase